MPGFPPPNVSAAAQAAFRKNHYQIIASSVAKLLAEPGAYDHLGEQAEQTLKAGFEFTSSSIEACLQMNNLSLLIDQLRWAKDRLPHDGIRMEQMANNLLIYCKVIREYLPPAHANEIITVVQILIPNSNTSLETATE
jgi:hypothetical protein